MLKIFFQHNNNNYTSRINYVLSFIENHPLVANQLKFSKDISRPFDLKCIYGEKSSDGFVIPSQRFIFSEDHRYDFENLTTNQYTYRHLKINSVSINEETETTFIKDKYFQFDILETIFFHISRMEEWYCKAEQMDNCDMMLSEEQFLVKKNLYQIPVVDHLVFAFASAIGLSLTPQKTVFRITHDIDEVTRNPSLFNTVRSTGGVLWRKQKMSVIPKIWAAYFSNRNEYNTFDWMLSDHSNIEKCIYFLVGGTTKYDTPYDLQTDEMKAIFSLCKERKYHIGIHPSYDGWRDHRLFKTEKEKLEQEINQPIEISRQHFLHFDFSKTPDILDQYNIKEDSSIGYRDKIGFRSGTGFGYRLYNFEKEKAYNFIEVPLVVMDSSLFRSTNHQPKDTAALWYSFLEKNKFHTKITFNFHNTRFYDAAIHRIPLRKWYQELFSIIDTDKIATRKL